MGEFAKAYLVRRNDVPAIDPYNCKTVKTMVVGKDVQWCNGRLALPFDGNRVDVVVKEGSAAPAPIRIDGKKPSEIPQLYGFTRAGYARW